MFRSSRARHSAPPVDIRDPLAYSMKMEGEKFEKKNIGGNPAEELSLIKQALPELVEELAEKGAGVELDTEGPVAVARKGASRYDPHMPKRKKKPQRSRVTPLLMVAVVVVGMIWATEQIASRGVGPNWLQFLFAGRDTGGMPGKMTMSARPCAARSLSPRPAG